jgi:hypothetical protein
VIIGHASAEDSAVILDLLQQSQLPVDGLTEPRHQNGAPPAGNRGEQVERDTPAQPSAAAPTRRGRPVPRRPARLRARLLLQGGLALRLLDVDGSRVGLAQTQPTSQIVVRATAECAKQHTGLRPSASRVPRMPRANTHRRRGVPPIVAAVVQPVARRLSRIEALLIEIRFELDVQLKRAIALQAQLDALTEHVYQSRQVPRKRKRRA